LITIVIDLSDGFPISIFIDCPGRGLLASLKRGSFWVVIIVVKKGQFLLVMSVVTKGQFRVLIIGLEKGSFG